MSATYHFYGDLPDLLRGRWRRRNPVVQEVTRSASVKDVLESFGLPHTEVGEIRCNGEAKDFSWPVVEGQSFEIFPIQSPWDVLSPSLLRPVSLPAVRFLADANVGRLARYLRLAGFDTLYDWRWDDDLIAAMVSRENRIVLSRDLGLLKRKQIDFGRCIRALAPAAQLREVLGLLDLFGAMQPFSRCPECNTGLASVEKDAVLHRLEPLTRKYYESFSRCPGCDRIYWPGSHREKMEQLLGDLTRPA
ncbi:MAG: Mut7-C RNAse domain-containing protein [Desulfobulbaceae bacterium]